MTRHYFSYLALGDSYTIGEAVPLYDSFPYQVVQLLRQAGVHIHAPEIVARTGWTTFELGEHILHTHLNEHYDFVTLLIGVNNQFRGLSAEDYTTDVTFLVHKAIHFAGGKKDHVIVLSIPDYGVTPFAEKMEPKNIATAIDAFNAINRKVATSEQVKYIDITDLSRKAGKAPAMLAHDGLHPSGQAYAEWAQLVADAIGQCISQ